MVLRGFVKNILCVYIGYKLLISAINGVSLADSEIMTFAVILLFFSIWYLLEKIGLIPRFLP